MMLNTSINHQPLWSQAGRTITTHKVFRSRQSGGLKVAGRSAGFRGVSSSVAELGTWRDDELVQSFVAGSPESEDQLILHENVVQAINEVAIATGGPLRASPTKHAPSGKLVTQSLDGRST
eukprot:scaffold39394_cov17-Tisochrysis_lutea.AAC.1